MILYVFLMCVYVCVFMYSRTIAHVELMFLLIKPTLNKVYFTLLYFTLLYSKENIDDLHYWPFVKETHQSLVDSP